KTAHEMFTDYIKKQREVGAWSGLELPIGTKILETIRVLRDDYFALMNGLPGMYDEYRAEPLQPTEGTIKIRRAGRGDLVVTANNGTGTSVWTGSLCVNASTGEITGVYQHVDGSGGGT